MRESFRAICKKHGETDFVIENCNRKQRRCKKCRSENTTRKRQNIKAKLVAFFGGKCLICGYNKNIGSLQFHHLNREEKKFGLSKGGLTRSFNKALEEAKKCVLLCANCHQEVEDGITIIPESN